MRPPRSRRLAVLGAAAVLALLTAKVVADDLAALHRRAEALGPSTPVVVARHDLALGATITAADVEVRGLHEPPPGALARPNAAVGRRLGLPVLAHTPLLAGHLDAGDRLVPEGMRAVRVAVTPAWDLPPGSVVDVLSSPDHLGLEPGGELAAVVAKGAVVLSGSSSSAGKDPVPGAENTNEVTLLVTVEAARRVASAGVAGPLALALAPPEDACCKTSSSVSSKG